MPTGETKRKEIKLNVAMKKLTKNGQQYEAVQWLINSESQQELEEFTNGSIAVCNESDYILIGLGASSFEVEPCDWVLKNPDGSFEAISDERLTMEFESESDFWVECNVCKTQLKNWTGSTPCCGSIAYLVENGKATNTMSLFASINGSAIQPTKIDFGNQTQP